MTDIAALLSSRKSEEFEGECHLTNEEADRIIAEIEHLRLSLSESRATGRREGLEEAARIAEQRITYRFDDGSPAITRPLPYGEAIAAAIRAAMEK